MLIIENPDHRPITLPAATPSSFGVMSPEDKQAVDAMAQGPLVPFNYQGAFGDNSGTPPGESRVVGDEVEMMGIMGAPNAGAALGSLVAILPVDQRPSRPRLLGCITTAGGPPTIAAFTLVIDDTVGTASGTPGAILLGAAVAATAPAPEGVAIIVEGLRFLL